MIEVKNIKKVYKTKGGVLTKALDDVSINIENHGMVFLLGKSGSGKSTLLNVIGGLDIPDDGEIIVKGKSSKDFGKSDFDNYRNTFIGFIFQEYNILNEFNIEQNIALALQLQGKKADSKAVEELLEQVDLHGLAKRKPNTLSGGQKQRIAIARALIKSPEIILADEPTGALDSNTGKQVFDTLKKLSKDKLIIVVSHDREFAEMYADRIIELSDGKIISDVSKETVAPKIVSDNVNVINNNIINVKNASELTDADAKKIISLIKESKEEVLITSGKTNVESSRAALHINSSGSSEVFNPTKDVKVEQYDGSKTKFIKSHMPISRAFKIGVSGLKTKPVRLGFTILLSSISFGLFGLVSTLTMYNPSYSLQEGLKKSDITSDIVSKSYKYTSESYEINNATKEKKLSYSNDKGKSAARFGVSEVQGMNKEGLDLTGIITFAPGYSGTSLTYSGTSVPSEYQSYYIQKYTNVNGFIDCGADYATRNFSLMAGAYPTNKTEIAISEYHYEYLKDQPSSEITKPEDLINKTIKLNGSIGNGNFSDKEFKITAIYKTAEIPSKYVELHNKTITKSDQEISDIKDKFNNYLNVSFEQYAFVSSDFYDEYKHFTRIEGQYVEPYRAKGVRIERSMPVEVAEDSETSVYLFEDTKSNVQFKYFNLDGTAFSSDVVLADNEIIVPQQAFKEFTQDKYSLVIDTARQLEYQSKYDSTSTEFFKEEGDFHKTLDRFESNRYNESYPDGKSAKEDCKTLVEGIKTWYAILASKNQIVEWTSNIYQSKTSEAEYIALPSDVKLLIETCGQKFIFNDFTLTNTEWNDLDNALKQHCTKLVESDFLYVDLFNLCMVGQFQDSYPELKTYCIEASDNDVANSIREKTASAEVVAKAKQMVNEYLPKFGSEVKHVYKSSFVYTEPEVNGEYFYRDCANKSGVLKIKGYYEGPSNWDCIVTSKFIDSVGKQDGVSYKTVIITNYVEPADAKYDLVICKAKGESKFNEKQIDILTKEEPTYSYRLMDNVTQTLSTFTELINDLKTGFIIGGAVMGGFAALMLVNFISTSITQKKREIGILRAVGARGSDVFKIFFSESSVISFISFVIACVAAGVGCYFINRSTVAKLNLALLNFNVINIALILGITVAVTFITTYIPTSIASRKPPVESIRAL